MVEIASNLNQATVYSPSAKTQNAVTSDFQTFFQMLTTQAENQDPLNPMDSAEYATVGELFIRRAAGQNE